MSSSIPPPPPGGPLPPPTLDTPIGLRPRAASAFCRYDLMMSRNRPFCSGGRFAGRKEDGGGLR